MKQFVYIIKSLFPNLHYIGHTSDLEDRLLSHNQNKNKFPNGSWQLVIFYTCSYESEAYQLELNLKEFKNSSLAIYYLKNMVLSIPSYSEGSKVLLRNAYFKRI